MVAGAASRRRRIGRACIGVVCGLALLLGVASGAGARPGQVDYSFGYFGTLDITDALPGPSSQRQALAMAVGPNDETVVLSAKAEACGLEVCADLFVSRFGADGALDQAFGAKAGVVMHVRQEPDPGRGASMRGSVAVDAAGRVVVAAGYDQTVVIDRLNADGSHDPSFHEPGLAPGGEVVRFLGGETTVSGVASMKSGGYLVAGAIRTATGTDLFLTRFQEQGLGEPEFGPIGSTVFADFGNDDLPTGIALRGARTLVGSPLCCAGSTATATVAEFGPKGEPSSAFRVKLPKRLGAGPAGGVSAVLPSGGKTLVVGSAKKGTFVARLLANGRPDPKYGDRGFALVRGLFVEGPSAAALDARGRVVLSGWRYDAPDDQGRRARIVRVFRLLPDGGPDRSFGGVRPLLTVADGTQKLGLDLNRSISMALRGDGRIMVLGEAAAGDPRARFTTGPWFGLVRVLGGGKVR